MTGRPYEIDFGIGLMPSVDLSLIWILRTSLRFGEDIDLDADHCRRQEGHLRQL